MQGICLILPVPLVKLSHEGPSIRWLHGVVQSPRVFQMFPSFESVNAYIALMAVLVNFTLAGWVILRSTRNLIYTTFMCVCFSVAFWNFGDFMVYASGHGLWPPAGAGHVSPWKYYSSTGSAMAVGFLFHFMCSLVKGARRKYGWILSAYVASGFFAVTSPMAIYYKPIRNFVDGTAWNIMFGITLVPFIVAGLIMLAISMMRARSADEKSRWFYTLIAIVITVATGLTDLVQKLQFPIPPLGHIGAAIGPTILAVGIFKHRRVFDVLTRTRVKLGAMSEMAAGIAHEIRNPLTAIRGAVKLQAEEFEEGNWEEAKRYQSIIADEIRRLDEILGSFQDFTRPIKLNKELRSINEIIGRTISMARMEEINLHLTPDLAEGIPECEVDPALLRQVFINLILNASDASGSDGELNISTDWIDPAVVISFRDNGPGIPTELQDRIFEPFYTTKTEGVGVGLAISKRIVDAHDGRIEVVKGTAKGAHMRIYLPGPS
jgi:signal transduction histidine kinase